MRRPADRRDLKHLAMQRLHFLVSWGSQVCGRAGALPGTRQTIFAVDPHITCLTIAVPVSNIPSVFV
jgi:hypothetical protein